MKTGDFLDPRDLLPTGRLRSGYIKVRLAHMPGATILHTDLILSNRTEGVYYAPKYFWAPSVHFFADNNYAIIPFAMENGAEIILILFQRDLVETFPDGTQVYRCHFVPAKNCKVRLRPDGRYRLRDGRFEIGLYHHTSAAGRDGILGSRSLWGSARNLKGDGQLQNLRYAYFTTIARVKNEADLLGIAMSSQGMTGLLPINAPLHPSNATWLTVPQKQPRELPYPLRFWVDWRLLSPNHAWVKRPLMRPVYYETVLPKVVRVATVVGGSLSFGPDMCISFPENRQKTLYYIVVGDGDTHDGLKAPFHEEETGSIAKLERIAIGDDIFAFWKRNANSDLFTGKDIEYVTVSSVVRY